MASASLEVNGDIFHLPIFGQPTNAGYFLTGIVQEDGHGRVFESPAHLAHDVANGLKRAGYNPQRVDDIPEVDYSYDLYIAKNGQALVDVYKRGGLVYRGRVKEIPYGTL